MPRSVPVVNLIGLTTEAESRSLSFPWEKIASWFGWHWSDYSGQELLCLLRVCPERSCGTA